MAIDDADVHIFMMIVKICADLHLFFCIWYSLVGPLIPLYKVHFLP